MTALQTSEAPDVRGALLGPRDQDQTTRVPRNARLMAGEPVVRPTDNAASSLLRSTPSMQGRSEQLAVGAAVAPVPAPAAGARLPLYLDPRRGAIEDENGCWLWQGTIDREGYPRIWVGNKVESDKVTRQAHRVSYEVYVGPIPGDLPLDHVCHTDDASCAGGDSCTHRRCINPRHLEPVTPLENAARQRRSPARTCANGHEMTPENTLLKQRRNRPNPARNCRICTNESQRRHNRRRRPAA